MNPISSSDRVKHGRTKVEFRNNQNVYLEKTADFKNFNRRTEQALSTINTLKQDSAKQLLFAQRIYLVKRAVYIYLNTATSADMLDLYQEGLLCLWDLIDLSSLKDDDFDKFLSNRIRNRLKVFRRRQLTDIRVLPKLINQGIQFVGMPDEMLDAIDDIQILVKEAMDDLSEKQRIVMAQFYGVGEKPMKVTEIAANQGKNPRTIRKLRKCGEVNLAKNQKIQALRFLVS
jgi:RNA polymerase sigma factor (sigma-70 family)